MAAEHIDSLVKARQQLVEQRRDLAAGLAKPYQRGETERWRASLIEVQTALDMVDKALAEEKRWVAGEATARSLGQKHGPEDAFGFDQKD